MADFPAFQTAYSPYQNGSSRVGSGSEGWNDFISNFSGPRRPGPESGMAVPHVLSLQAIVGTSFRTYWHGQYDEAIRDSQDNADAMRNDPFIRRLVDERKHAVCSLKPSIEVDNPRDPWQKAMKDSLTQQWKDIWCSYDLNWYLLEALYYGRYAGQFTWKKKVMDLPALPKPGGVAPGLPMILGAPTGREKRKVMSVARHIPFEGDKIGYDYDGVPYLLVYTGTQSSGQLRGADLGPLPNIHAKNFEYGYTTAGGKALFLRSPSWRQRFAIHHNEILDGPFMDAEKGDQIHGIGIRSVIYWYWWLRDEFLANVADWCARTGLGVRLWYYESGNQASELAIDQAARDQSDKVNIKVPYIPGSDLKEPVQFVDTTGSGADLLLKIVQHVEDQIELYVVGQSMSRGATEPMNTGFGDRGRTDFARSCVPLDSEILTRAGFKTHDQVVVGEEVLAYDAGSDCCRWTPLLAKSVFQDAEIVRMHVDSWSGNPMFEVLCTPDHSWAIENRVYESDYRARHRGNVVSVCHGARGAVIAKGTRRYLKKAFEINTRDRIILSAHEVGLPESLLTPIESSILGWAITDGTIARGRTGNWKLKVCQSKENYVEEIRRLVFSHCENVYEFKGKPFVRTFPTGQTYDCKPQHWWSFPEAVGTMLLDKCGYQGRSSLPGIATRLSSESRRAMLDAMMKGDGSIAVCSKFINTDKYIMETFEILCALEGIATGKVQIKTDVPDGCKPCMMKTVKVARYTTGQKMKKQEVPRQDVWCPTTKFGTWVMRQNGQVMITGNTKYQITKRDAAKFGDTMTTDVLDVMKRWSFPPDLQEIPVRVVYNVDNPDPEQYMNSAKVFVDMGGTIREDEARQTLGFSSPHEGDAVLGGAPPVQPGAEGKESPFGKKDPTEHGESVETNGKARFRRKSDHDMYAKAKEGIANLHLDTDGMTDNEKVAAYKKAIEEMLDGSA